MKKKLSLIYCLALLAFSAQAAYACSCIEVKKGTAVNYKRWLKTFDGAVFTGRVIKTEKSEADHQLKVTFDVERHWKGAGNGEAVIYTAMDSAACGVSYTEGETYFVVARNYNGKLMTDLCSHLEYTKNKKTMMRKLGRGKIPRA
jgi:hypothetical protein